MEIPLDLRSVLGGATQFVVVQGLVVLRRGDSRMTVARLNNGAVRHNVGLDGQERPAAWRAAIEQLAADFGR